MNVGLVSLGCCKNQVDAEKLLFRLKQAGFEFCRDLSRCEVIVVNTCGFIEEAKQESINCILEVCSLKESFGGLKKVVVTGCLAQRYKEEILKNIKEVDLVLGIGANQEIVKLLNQALESDEKLQKFPEVSGFSMEGGRSRLGRGAGAYVKVSDGCNNRCSYCAIPLIRGPLVSRRQEDILKEARELASQGVKEINLVAQDTTEYGLDIYGKCALAELIAKISEIEEVGWIRVLYCHPDHITDELLEELNTNPKCVKYLDIPLQHVDETILRQMNRKGNAKTISALLKKIREKVPGIVIRTTFIVGFPGESGAQFEALCDFVKAEKFERLGCFAYSEEEGTKAANLPDKIDAELKEMRVEALLDAQSLVIERISEGLVGRTFKVLVLGQSKSGRWFGRSYMDAPEVDGMVYFEGGSARVGEFVNVKIEDYEGYDLFGRVEEKTEF